MLKFSTFFVMTKKTSYSLYILPLGIHKVWLLILQYDNSIHLSSVLSTKWWNFLENILEICDPHHNFNIFYLSKVLHISSKMNFLLNVTACWRKLSCDQWFVGIVVRLFKVRLIGLDLFTPPALLRWGHSPSLHLCNEIIYMFKCHCHDPATNSVCEEWLHC